MLFILVPRETYKHTKLKVHEFTCASMLICIIEITQRTQEYSRTSLDRLLNRPNEGRFGLSFWKKRAPTSSIQSNNRHYRVGESPVERAASPHAGYRVSKCSLLIRQAALSRGGKGPGEK